MKNLSLLLTLDQQEDHYNTYLLDYRIGSSLTRDSWGSPRLLATQTSACGWQSGGIPLLSGEGQALAPAEFLPARSGARLSTDGRWLWQPHPQAPWPAPHRITQTDRRLHKAEVIWQREGWEILDLQVAADGRSLYFAVRSPDQRGQLWHWCPVLRKSQLHIDNLSFHPIDMAIHPGDAGVAYVDQQDDQVYFHAFGSSQTRRLSQPARELENPEAPGVYRCSPAFTPDGSRLFYCTAFLEMDGAHLSNSGNLYVTSLQSGKLRRVDLGDEGCPVNLCLPSWSVYSAMAIAS
jgi:hypothetical protein